jgi:hypothetical protein
MQQSAAEKLDRMIGDRGGPTNFDLRVADRGIGSRAGMRPPRRLQKRRLRPKRRAARPGRRAAVPIKETLFQTSVTNSEPFRTF